MRLMKPSLKTWFVWIFLPAVLLLISSTASAAPTLRDSWNMDEDPGWTTQGLWAYWTPLGGGGNDMG
ncbi:MAG: hypothetical protein LJE96_09790 [Deltaproteobacteria bacterium]|nr:hypothetical protein [Deltaproteobacteria bacterium]